MAEARADDPVTVYRKWAGRRTDRENTVTANNFARYLDISLAEFTAMCRADRNWRYNATTVAMPPEEFKFTEEQIRAFLTNREKSPRSIANVVYARIELEKLERARLAALATGFIHSRAPARSVQPRIVVRTCAAEDCTNTFEVLDASTRKYCSSRCRYRIQEKHYRCECCGTEFASSASLARYCSVKCRNAAAHQNARKRQLADA
jgi:hypothetical protein